jgi:hypothetical protein
MGTSGDTLSGDRRHHYAALAEAEAGGSGSIMATIGTTSTFNSILASTRQVLHDTYVENI